MKLLFISHEYPPVGGGGGNACMNIAEEFVSGGHDVHVLTVLYNHLPDDHTEIGEKLRIFRVPARRSGVSQSSFTEMLDFIRRAGPYAEKLCAKEKYDLCLCFYGMPSGVLALRLKKKFGLPYVVRFGGGDIPGFQERFKILYRVLSPKIRQIWGNAGRLVANSEGLKTFAQKFCAEYRIDVISNGVDSEEFKPLCDKECPSGKQDETVRLLTVCRLIERKGLQDIVPHIHELEKKTNKKIEWIIVGDGPYSAALMDMAAGNGTDDAICFEGHKKRDELADYYRNADIFVFPSYKEGMPNVVLEAMASGLPVIMRKSCQGSQELIRDNGIASDGDFMIDLEEMINMAPGQISEMGRQSRLLAETEFSWKHVTDEYEKLFLALL